MIGFDGDVLIDQMSHRLRLEKSARECPLGKQSLTQKRLHGATEPVTDGNSESHLTAVQVFCGH